MVEGRRRVSNGLACATHQTAKETVMAQPVVCPDLAQYQQLAAGTLADADEEALLEHLEHCDRCAQKVNTLAEQDSLVELIRRQQVQSDQTTDNVVGRLVERLSTLRPGETLAGPDAAGSVSSE